MKKIFAILALGLLFAGCNQELQDRVDVLEGKVTKAESSLETLSGQVGGLNTVMTEWQKGGFITSIQAIEGGHTITFAGGKTVTLLDGARGPKGDPGVGTPGTPGHSPVVSVIIENGVAYWAVDGKIVTVDGKKVPVYEAAPQFKVEDGNLYMSVDGKTWENIGKVVAEVEVPAPVIEKVEVGEESVVFTLPGGGTFEIPFAKAFGLVLESLEYDAKAGEVISIPFTLKYANDKTVVDVFGDRNYKASVDMEKSLILVTPPTPIQAGQVIVWADNGEGLTSIKKLTFNEAAVFECETVDFEAPAAGGSVEIPVVSNMEFEVTTSADWLTYVETKAPKAYTIVVSAAANSTEEARTADVNILRKGTETVLQTVKIAQLPKLKVPALEKVWGFESVAGTLWTTNVTAIAITHPDAYGMARGLAMDDEYIYLPKSSAFAAVCGVSVADPSAQVKGSVTGVTAGSEFKSSFVRMIKNTDPAVNGGKDVLLMSNLTATNAANLVIYAYTNGITEAPVILAQFAWDGANNVQDWRRYGDRFFVTGTWQDGKIYLPSFNYNKGVVLSVANGARTAVQQIAAGAANSPDGIKDMTVYPGGSKLFITNTAVANLVAPTGGKANGWDEYTLSGSSAKAVGTFGYNFFTFEGNDYIAYARLGDESAQIEVIEDKGGEDNFLASLEAQEGLLTAPIQGEFATGNLADCCVRTIDGVTYIAALSRDGGFALYKMVLK